MFEIFWGEKTAAIMDFWTIEHFFSGIILASFVQKFSQKIFEKTKISRSQKKYFNLIFILFLAYFWETIEHYLETGAAGKAAADWFCGVEFWANRILADPAMLLLGFFFAQKFPRFFWPARIFSFLWIFVHIFIFPHSMFLHEIF